MVLTVVAGHGRAGATTVSLVWAYCRPETVVVEANPAGGDVWAWSMVPDTGLAELAAVVVRHGEANSGQLAGCARATGYGVQVVTAPATAQGAAASVAAVAGVLPKLAADVDMVVDVGRLDLQATSRVLMEAADRVLLLVMPTAAELARLAGGLDAVRQVCGQRLTVAAVDTGWSGPPPHRDREVAGLLGDEVMALPYDPRTAGTVAGRPGVLPPAGRRWRWWQRWRFPLLEAVRRL